MMCFDYHYVYYNMNLIMEDFSCVLCHDYNCRYDGTSNPYDVRIFYKETCNDIKKLANEYSYYGIEFVNACIELLLDIFEDKEIKCLNEQKNVNK